MNFDHSTCSIKYRTEKFLKYCPQKRKKINSHKYFHGKSRFAALCCEVTFLHIRKNLLGHFSKLDKEKSCPFFKNGPRSFSGVFMWELYICGIIDCNTNIMLQMFIIFMYLHENNIGCLVRFSISSKNFCKNNPKYYNAGGLSSFTRGKNNRFTRL